MPSNRDTIAVLRDALRRAPGQLPLVLHLAALLEEEGELQEAEALLRQTLAAHPDDVTLQLRLARVFAAQRKDDEALVILEDLAQHPSAPADVYDLLVALFVRKEDLGRARSAYQALVRLDPARADAAREAELGVARMPAGDRPGDYRGAPSSDEALGHTPDRPVEKPQISFAHVGGMDAVKEQIRLKLIHPLQHPELYRAYGKPIGGGLLLYGPPGCGKTYLARATAGEIDARFVNVGIHDVLDMYIGESERNLHELFELARRSAPCVLFFDEVDALGANRSDMRHSAGRHLINQFLAELDGVGASNEGVLVLAATNAPWNLDPAFRRPGRFDRVLFVPPPDAAAREAILRVMLAGKPLGEVDVAKVAKQADGFSGADLKAVVDQSVETKLQEAIRTGRLAPLDTRALLDAAKAIRPTTREWFGTARNYALYANQSGLYDDILPYIKR